MHIEVFLHANSGRPTTASVKAWWVSGSGVKTSYLLDRAELDVEQGRETDPWALLAALWATLAERYQARATSDPESRTSPAPTPSDAAARPARSPSGTP